MTTGLVSSFFCVKHVRLVTLVVYFSAIVIQPVDADAFRGSDWAPSSSWEAVDPESEKALLTEIEESLGSDHRHDTEHRLATVSPVLGPTFAAMPKNEYGNLGHTAVRYTLHRYFVQQHGWFVRGLEPRGESWNASSPVEILKDHAPVYVQGLFEKRLGGRGFGLHEVAVLAATLENFMREVAVTRLSAAYRVHRLPLDSKVEVEVVDEVIDTFMASYVVAQDIAKMSPGEAVTLRKQILDVYPPWLGLQQFIRDIRLEVGRSFTEWNFANVAAVVTAIEDRYWRYQDQQCQAVKDQLLRIEEPGTGCVRLSKFFHSHLHEGVWQFGESANYLEELGALDTADPKDARIIVANYVTGPNNCAATSSNHMVCCRNECEGFLSLIEQKLARPDATPEEIVAVVAEFPPSTQGAKRSVAVSSLLRLHDVAQSYGGKVPLHGRLFAQWMHFAFPQECPYPHVSGKTRPLGLDDFFASGRDPFATSDEITKTALPKSFQEDGSDIRGSCTQWSHEEENPFIPRYADSSASALENDADVWFTVRCVAGITMLASFAITLLRVCRSVRAFTGVKPSPKSAMLV